MMPMCPFLIFMNCSFSDQICDCAHVSLRVRPRRVIGKDRFMGTPTKAIVCPDCGLALRVTRDAEGSTLTYDFGDWQWRCKRVELDDPAWCLIQRDGSAKIAAAISNPVCVPLRRVG